MTPGRTWASALQEAKAYALHPEQDEELLMNLCWVGMICVAEGCDPDEPDTDLAAITALLITATFLPRREPNR